MTKHVKYCFFWSLLVVISVVKSQNPIYKDLEDKVTAINTNTHLILSHKSFNRYVGHSLSSFISSSNDLNFSRAYSLLDNTDGRLFVGGNIPLRCPKDKDRIFTFVTLGAKSKITDKIAEIVSNERISNDVTAEIKLTVPVRFFMKYDGMGLQEPSSGKTIYRDGVQKGKMNVQRKLILEQLKQEALKEIDEFEKGLSGLSEDEKAELRLEKETEMKKKIEKEFYEKELAAFEQDKPSYSNSYKGVWLSLSGSIPLSGTKYKIAENYTVAPHDVYFYNSAASARITYFHEWYKVIKYFVNVSYIGNQVNTITQNDVEQSTINTVVPTGSNSTVTNETKVYFTSFEQKFISNLKAQFIFYPLPIKNKVIGLNIFANRDIDNNENTWGIGLPLSLKGKEDKAPVNFELLVNKLNQPKKLTVSISLLLPFSSIIY